MFASRVIARGREFTPSRRPRQQLIDLAALARESVALLDWDLQRGDVRLHLALPPSSPLMPLTAPTPVVSLPRNLFVSVK